MDFGEVGFGLFDIIHATQYWVPRCYDILSPYSFGICLLWAGEKVK